MFFPKLRSHAKWMFLALALVFALGFVGFGVGAGGIGVGDIFRDGGSGGGDTPSVSKARERIEKNPKDAKAHRDLATALQVEGETAGSIAALERYTELAPKDIEALRELAGLYLVQAGTKQEEAQVAQLRAQYLTGGGAGVFTQPLQLTKDIKLDQDPITQAVSAETSEAVNEAYQGAQLAYANASDVYTRLAAATPDDPTIQITLAQTAQQSGDLPTAIAAYEAFLKLAPDDPNAELVKEQVKQLKASQAPASG